MTDARAIVRMFRGRKSAGRGFSRFRRARGRAAQSFGLGAQPPRRFGGGGRRGAARRGRSIRRGEAWARLARVDAFREEPANEAALGEHGGAGFAVAPDA